MNKKVFVHYLDRAKGKDIDVNGFFELIKETDNFIFIKTDKNILRIPMGRIVKIKEEKNKI